MKVRRAALSDRAAEDLRPRPGRRSSADEFRIGRSAGPFATSTRAGEPGPGLPDLKITLCIARPGDTGLLIFGCLEG